MDCNERRQTNKLIPRWLVILIRDLIIWDYTLEFDGPVSWVHFYPFHTSKWYRICYSDEKRSSNVSENLLYFSSYFSLRATLTHRNGIFNSDFENSASHESQALAEVVKALINYAPAWPTRGAPRPCQQLPTNDVKFRLVFRARIDHHRHHLVMMIFRFVHRTIYRIMIKCYATAHSLRAT